MSFFPRDEYYMRLALREAERAVEHDDVPIGCVIARDGEVVAAFPNERELRQDPTAHCEILALREAARSAGSWRLNADVLYVTLEPCAMCAGAISLARVARLVYAAADPKGGAVEHGPRFFAQPTCHHRPQVARAGDADAAGRVLQDFFRARRG